MKCDESTLLSLATQAHTLRDEAESAQKKNVVLEREIALLKAQLSQANKTSVASQPNSLFGASANKITSDTNQLNP